MPICPHCNASIHAGAVDQCPACGYGMHRADAIFGDNEVEFTRVVDAAGALTHRERMDLLRYLERLEKRLKPVALGVYITDHGQTADFRHHAHWILNHARIHHPSFGKREQHRAVEDAALIESRPGEYRGHLEEEKGSWWKNLITLLQDWRSSCPPPVKQENLLILVLDVQLELACFSWGYMLDPYVNPDKINTCIVKARLLFRERAMVSALKKVMSLAVRQIAASSRRVNKKLRSKTGFAGYRAIQKMLAVSTAGALLAGAPYSYAQSEYEHLFDSDEAAEIADDDVAELVEPAPAVTAPQPYVPPVKADFSTGEAASYHAAPKWSSHDYGMLMNAELTGAYNMLLPDAPPPTAQPTAQQAQPTPEGVSVRGCYTEDYRPRPGRSVPELNDPQKLLTDVERADAVYELERLNAHSPFRIYVSLYRREQLENASYSVAELVRLVAGVDEYAVMLHYGLGDTPLLEVGFKSIDVTDAQRHEIYARLDAAVNAAGGGSAGLLAAMRCLHECINPMASTFVPLSAGSGFTLSNVLDKNIGAKPEEEEEESTMDKVLNMVMGTGLVPYLMAFLAAVLGVGGYILLRFLFPKGGHLLETRPDVRLNSRYGAGVSRYVRYLEGQEDAKVKNIF